MLKKFIISIFMVISGQLWAAQMSQAEQEQYLQRQQQAVQDISKILELKQSNPDAYKKYIADLEQSNYAAYIQLLFDLYSRDINKALNESSQQEIPLDLVKEILRINKSYVFHKVATLKVQYESIALSSKGILAFSELHGDERPRSIKFWDIKNNSISDFEIPIDQEIKHEFKWSTDGSMLAVFKRNSRISVWDYQNRSKIYEVSELEPMFGKNGEDYDFFVCIIDFAWSPDGSKLAVIERGYCSGVQDPEQFRLKIYDIQNKIILAKQDFLGIEVDKAYWFKENSLALVGVVRKDYKSSGEWFLNIYDIHYDQRNKITLQKSMPLKYGYLTSINSNGSRLVTAENKYNVEVFETDDFELIATQELDQLIDLENGYAQKIRLSENNNILAIEIIDESGSYIALIDLERNILLKKISISPDVSQIPRRLNRLNFIWSTEPNSMYLAVYNGNDPNDPSIDIWQGARLK